jgi:hypothetical protein
MVAISRAMAVGDSKQALRKIGRKKAYQVRRDFLIKLRAKGEESQAREKQKISTFFQLMQKSWVETNMNVAVHSC